MFSIDLFGAIFILQLFVAAIVGYDAYHRERNPFSWFVVTILFGFLAVILYIATNPSKKAERVEEELTKIEESMEYCPKCGADIEDGNCANCGFEVGIKEAETEVEEDEEPPIGLKGVLVIWLIVSGVIAVVFLFLSL